MNKSERQNIVVRVYAEHNISHMDEAVLRKIISSEGFTVIDFHRKNNNDDVAYVINSLKLTSHITEKRGFTYVNSDYRLVFVNAELTDKEKCIVLSHELGHILCKHYKNSNIIGNDVLEEAEANELSYELLNPTMAERRTIWIRLNRRKVLLVSLLSTIILCLVAAIFIYAREKQYYGVYYVTEHGERYHERDCSMIKNKTNIRRLTNDDYNSGKYTPCQVCLP